MRFEDSDRSYRDSYLRAITRVKELQETMKQKEAQYALQEREEKITEDITRSLCELILAKDRRESKLGDAYSWRRFSTRELVQKTISSYKDQESHSTKMMETVFNALSSRRKENDLLRAENERVIANQVNLTDRIEENKFNLDQATATQRYLEEHKDKINSEFIKGYNRGEIDLVMESDDEDTIIGNLCDHARELSKAADKAKLEKYSERAKRVLVKNSPAQQEEQQKIISETMTDDFAEYEELTNNLNEDEWAVIETIGRTGESRAPQITAAINGKINITRVGQRLLDSGILEREKAPSPISSRNSYWKLSFLGRRIYGKKYGTEPAPAECDLIVQEHRTLEHGYGIKACYDVLMSVKDRYKQISMFNKKRPLKLSDGHTLEPDILLIGNNGALEIIEYELGTHNQKNFNLKMNRICRIVMTINIIAPSDIVIRDVLKKEIDYWLQNHPHRELIDKHIIRLTTYNVFKNGIEKGIDEWKYVIPVSEFLNYSI